MRPLQTPAVNGEIVVMGDWSRRCRKSAFTAATTIGPDSYYFLKAHSSFSRK